MNDLVNITGALANSDLFKSLQELNDKIAGGGGNGEYKRISLKGGKFRMMVNGEQVGKPRSDSLNIVIIDAAPISRTYYEGVYDPSNVAPPTCWSSDSKTPDVKVPKAQRQSDKCATCPMAVKGSGQGNSAACRFSQRLAVAVEGDMEEAYLLQLPAKSIFGAADGGKMPLQAYAKYLNGHKAPAIAVVTEMYFDEDSDTPKVFFKPVRGLQEDELKAAVALRDSDEVKELLVMTVAEADGVTGKQKQEPVTEVEQPEPKKKPAPKKKPPVVEEPEQEDDEPVEEPVKVSSKKSDKTADAIDDDLADLIDEWDE